MSGNDQFVNLQATPVAFSVDSVDTSLESPLSEEFTTLNVTDSEANQETQEQLEPSLETSTVTVPEDENVIVYLEEDNNFDAPPDTDLTKDDNGLDELDALITGGQGNIDYEVEEEAPSEKESNLNKPSGKSTKKNNDAQSRFPKNQKKANQNVPKSNTTQKQKKQNQNQNNQNRFPKKGNQPQESAPQKRGPSRAAVFDEDGDIIVDAAPVYNEVEEVQPSNNKQKIPRELLKFKIKYDKVDTDIGQDPNPKPNVCCMNSITFESGDKTNEYTSCSFSQDVQPGCYEVHYSNSVFASAKVHHSSTVNNSLVVVRSINVNNSNDVHNSQNVNFSRGVKSSSCVYGSSLVEHCNTVLGCKNIRNCNFCILCNKISNQMFMIQNKPALPQDVKAYLDANKVRYDQALFQKLSEAHLRNTFAALKKAGVKHQ